jgi:choline-glycine betaine transporter
MVSSAPVFFQDVQRYIDLLVLIGSIIVQGVALVHSLTQRGDGFTAIGTLPKGAWVAILAVCIVLTLLLGSATSIFCMIGVGAALIYLLDVRTGLKDLSDGKGFW